MDFQDLDLYQEEDQKPIKKRSKRIKVRSFLIAQTEVTVAQYRKCVQAKVCSKPDPLFLEDGCTWSSQPGNQESKPMTCVTREEALIFSKWVGGSLPSHAQWYHAARGGDSSQSRKPNHLIKREWLDAKEDEGPFDVAQKIANSYGLYDVLGNVSELIAPKRKHKHEEDSLPCGCESIYFRGGSWIVPIEEINYSIWNGINADRKLIFVGFRPVK